MEMIGQLHGPATVFLSKTSSRTKLMGSWLGPRTGKEIFGNKNHLPCWESKHESSVFQHVTYSLYQLSYPPRQTINGIR